MHKLRSGRIYKDLHSAASMSETGDHSGGASPVRELPSESTTDSTKKKKKKSWLKSLIGR